VTPGAIVRVALAGLGIIPGLPRIVRDIIGALDDLPDLIEEVSDGEWTDEDIDALAGALRAALDDVPGVPARHARRIANGLASACDLIVATVRGIGPVERPKARAKLAKARGDALPSPDTRPVQR